MCIFCMLALTLVSASLNAVMLGNIETRLNRVANGLKRAIDTESTVVWNATVKLKGVQKQIPLAIHIYKPHKRARVQILTHEITQPEAEMVENIICEALEARIISRHFPKRDDFPQGLPLQSVRMKGNEPVIAEKSDDPLKPIKIRGRQNKRGFDG